MALIHKFPSFMDMSDDEKDFPPSRQEGKERNNYNHFRDNKNMFVHKLN